MRNLIHARVVFSLFAVLFLEQALIGCSSEETATGANTSTSVYSNSPSITWIGEYSGSEYIANPQYLWVYYNTTDGCSYIFTQAGWGLLAHGGANGLNGVDGKNGIDGRDGVDGKDGTDGRDGVDGRDGTDGLDGVNGRDGTDGRDGVDGKDGTDGRDGVDGKDGTDGRDGVDGKDGVDGNDGENGSVGNDAYVHIRTTEEIEDGVTYRVESYAQLEAGSAYFYTYYKFYFLEDTLKKSYVCYHTVANVSHPEVAYWDFREAYSAMEPEYIKTYSDGYVSSYTARSGTTISYSTYWPKSKNCKTTTQYSIKDDQQYKTYYGECYENGQTKSSIAYQNNGNMSRTYKYDKNGGTTHYISYNADESINSYNEYYENGKNKYYILYDEKGVIQYYYEYYKSGQKKYNVDYKNGQAYYAYAYNEDGSIKSRDLEIVLALMNGSDINQLANNTANNEDSVLQLQVFEIDSIRLSRYHIFNDDESRLVLVTAYVNDASLIDTSLGLYMQVVNVNQDSFVVNYKALVVENNIITANIDAPVLVEPTATGVYFEVRMKNGNAVYKDDKIRFNVSASYSNVVMMAPSKINIDKTQADSFSISISGNNLDFISNMYVNVLDKDLNKLGDSICVNLMPLQWLDDTYKNAQSISIKIPTPQMEGEYALDLYINDTLYSKNKKVIIHKNPYFVDFAIPSAKQIDAGKYISAVLKGNNFKKAALDISRLNLTFSLDYEVVDDLKYEAALVNDSIINLRILVPNEVGRYDITANYGQESISSIFEVTETTY